MVIWYVFVQWPRINQVVAFQVGVNLGVNYNYGQ